ncbi:MAG: hypothetical protein ACOC8E_08490 [Planctomycetota bacterium]
MKQSKARLLIAVVATFCCSVVVYAIAALATAYFGMRLVDKERAEQVKQEQAAKERAGWGRSKPMTPEELEHVEAAHKRIAERLRTDGEPPSP